MAEPLCATVAEDCIEAQAAVDYLRRHIKLISRHTALSARLHKLSQTKKSWIQICGMDGIVRFEPGLEMLTLMAEVDHELKRQAALSPLDWWMIHKEGR